MARTPNYRFERMQRDRDKAAKKAAKREARAARRAARKAGLDPDLEGQGTEGEPAAGNAPQPDSSPLGKPSSNG